MNGSYIIHHTSYITSYHIMSCHIISYHIISYFLISYPLISFHIISSHIILSHLISYHLMTYYILYIYIFISLCEITNSYGSSQALSVQGQVLGLGKRSSQNPRMFELPRHSMYDLFTYIWPKCMVNVGKTL